MGESSVESGSMESGWMVVSLVDESVVEELLVRLRTLGIEPAGVSVVRVETDRISRSGRLVVDAGSKWEPAYRHKSDKLIEPSAIGPPERSPGRQFRKMVIAFLVGIGLLFFGIPRLDTVRGLLLFGLMLLVIGLVASLIGSRSGRPHRPQAVPRSRPTDEHRFRANIESARTSVPCAGIAEDRPPVGRGCRTGGEGVRIGTGDNRVPKK
jgi:hypothetical protein